jgi:hypothetical protein
MAIPAAIFAAASRSASIITEVLAQFGPSDYLDAMALISPSSYWRDVSPTGAVADFRAVYQQAGRNRWRFAAAAAAVTFAIFSLIWQEGGRGPPRPPEVTIITSWPEGRSDAEIIASNIANQKRNDRLAAAQARREEEVRQMYRTIGRMSGMDVDAIEQQAAADRAAEQQAKLGHK